jgi:TP901 family phage tail tape measure protein
MSMKVSLILDLVNRMAPGAQAAKRELKGLKDAARQIDGQRAGQGLAQTLARAGRAADATERQLREAGREARALDGQRAGQGLAASLTRAGRAADQAERQLREAGREARALDGQRAGQGLAQTLARAGRAADQAEREVKGLNRETRRLGQESGADRAAAGLDRLRRQSERARRELQQVRRELRETGKSSAGFGAVALTGRKKPGAQAGAGVQAPAAGAAGGLVAAGGARLMGGLVAAGGVYGGVRGTVGQSVSFEKAMADVQKKVDVPEGESLTGLERMIRRTAIEIGLAREQVAGLVAEAGAAGVPFAELERWTKLTAKAAIAWDMPARQASQKLAEIKAGTGMTLDQIEELADKVNGLGDTSAAKEGQIVEMFQRAGAAAKAAGVDFDASLAFLTALKAIGINEESASRGFNAFASTLRIASDKPKRVAEGLKMLGLSAKEVEEGMKTNATRNMIDVLERLETSGDKAKAAVKIFGQEWWDEVARAGQAIPEIRKNLAYIGSGKWRGSLDKGLNIELATTANHLERLKALSSEVGDRLGRWALPGINAAIERLIAGLDALDKRAEDKQEVAATAKQVAEGQPLTPEQRRKMADDAVFRTEVEVAAKEQRDAEATRREAETRASLRRESQQGEDAGPRVAERRAAIEAQIKALESRRDAIPRGTIGRETIAVPGINRQIAAKRAELDALASRTDRGDDGSGERQAMRLRNLARAKLDQEIDDLAKGLAIRDPSGRDSATLGDRRKLESLRGRRRALGDAEQVRETPLMDRSDADETRARRGFSAAAQARSEIEALRQRLAVIDSLTAGAGNAADRAGFRADGDQLHGQIARKSAPEAIAASRFGFGPGGAPKTSPPHGPTMSGLNAFGVGSAGQNKQGQAAADYVRDMKARMEIDFGDAGVPLMERLAAGIRTGGAGVTAAAGEVGDGVKSAFAGADLNGAGLSMMAGLAAGIRAGGAQAIAEAQKVAQAVKSAAASGAGGGGSSRAVSGALHDGVV